MNWTLHIGCEDQILHTDGGGIVQLDMRPGHQANCLGDMRQLPFSDQSFDRLFASHVLEHQAHWEVPTTLAEWARVLKPGARYIVMVPNFEAAMVRYLHNKEIDQGAIFGAWLHPYDKHGCGFSRHNLEARLEEAGFGVQSIKEIDLENGGPTLRADGIKQEAINV